jgi:hypothetical protein
MLRLSIIIILFLSLVGCKTDNISNVDKYEIYSAVFDRIIGKEDKWRKKAKGSLLWLSASLKTKSDSLKNRELLKWLDSTNRVIDTAKLYVILDDTLIPQLPLEASFEMTFRNNKVIEKDTTFISVLKGLYKRKKSIETIDRSKIRSQYNYKIIGRPYSPRDEFKEVGILSISVISLNKENNIACVYTSLTCGSLCGYGRVFFLKKKIRQWVVLGHENLWIS